MATDGGYIDSLKINNITYDINMPVTADFQADGEFYCTNLREGGVSVFSKYAPKIHPPGAIQDIPGVGGNWSNTKLWVTENENDADRININTKNYYTSGLTEKSLINAYSIPKINTCLKPAYTLTITGAYLTDGDALTIIRASGNYNTYIGSNIPGTYHDVVAFYFGPVQTTGSYAGSAPATTMWVYNYSNGSSRNERASSWRPIMVRRPYRKGTGSQVFNRYVGITSTYFSGGNLPYNNWWPNAFTTTAMFYLMMDTTIYVEGLAS